MPNSKEGMDNIKATKKLATKYKSNRDLVLKEYAKGNIVFMGIEDSPMICPIKDFLKQPIEGILYDLNRSEVVVLSWIKDPKWVNDYAVSKVIQELYKASRINEPDRITNIVSLMDAERYPATGKRVYDYETLQSLKSRIKEIKQ